MKTATSVLVINHSEQFLFDLHTLLENLGYTSVTAVGGEEGLHRLEQESPEIVIVGLIVPNMDRMEVIAEIRKRHDYLPVIVISAHGSHWKGINAMRSGAWDYLRYPTNEHELEISIERCLERARIHRRDRHALRHLEELVALQSAEIQESRSRYKRLIETVASYVYTVVIRDGSPVETIHRQGCELITGYTLDEFNADVGLWYRIIHEDDRSLAFGMAQLILADPKNQTLEHRILHKNGSIRWVTNKLIPFRKIQSNRFISATSSGGILIAYDVIITDITRRKMERDGNSGCTALHSPDSVYAAQQQDFSLQPNKDQQS